MSVVTPLRDVLPSEALSQEEISGPWLRHGEAPEAVVHPESTEEVAATLRWAAESGVSVLPLGSGRRFGRAWREGRFLVMSSRRLSGVEVYEPADLTLTARAGTPLGPLDAQLRAHRQWLPFDPPHAPERTLGGLVATGESGPLWMGYGELRNHVLGMTVVSGDGRTLRLGGRVVKNVAGFDLLKLMVGSNGRLGMITSVCLRTFPVPGNDRLLALRGESAHRLAGSARAVGTAPVMPVSSVLVEPAAALDAGAALLVRLHGAERTVDSDQRSIEQHVGAPFEVVADGAALSALARDHAATGDVVLRLTVLPSRLEAALAAVGDLPGAQVAADTYGGKARVAPSALDPDGFARLRDALAALGGTLSVCSGSDSAELSDVSSTAPPEVLELSTRLERVFDPESVLWPPRS